MPYDVSVDVEPPAEGVVDGEALAAFLREVLDTEAGAAVVEGTAALTLLVTGDERLTALNRQHRGVDSPTDVLSFPSGEGDVFPQPDGHDRYLGDIAVSVETVRRQADEVALTFDLELRHVALHGLLHLLGYDHETDADEAVMRAREEAVLGPAIHAGDRAHAEE